MLNKDDRTKLEGLGRDRGRWSKGSSGDLAPSASERMDARTQELEVVGRGAATPALGKPWLRQDPRLCSVSTLWSCDRWKCKCCRLRKRGGFASRLHPLSCLQSIHRGELSSARHPSCHRGRMVAAVECSRPPLSIWEGRGAASTRPTRHAPVAELCQRPLHSEAHRGRCRCLQRTQQEEVPAHGGGPTGTGASTGSSAGPRWC